MSPDGTHAPHPAPATRRSLWGDRGVRTKILSAVGVTLVGAAAVGATALSALTRTDVAAQAIYHHDVVLVPADRVDRVGARPVAHIGDQLLPLVHLLGGPVLDDAHVGPFVVVVLEHGGRTVAAVVDEVIDVSDSEPPAMLDTTDGGPVACAGLVQGRITSLLDVRAAVLAADPAWPLPGIDGCGDRGVVGVTSWTNS